MTPDHAITSPAPSSAASLLRRKIVHVTRDEQLAELGERWLQCRILAVDTEFMRTSTYYPIVALVQISDGECNYLIDPLVISNWQPLVAIFEAPSIIKIFHACSEDLDVFHGLISSLPTPMLDTQVAVALTGMNSGMGYSNLVKTMVDVDLPKGETRSNWLERPLSASQIDYAALDVDYLWDVAQRLIDQLQAMGRLDWALAEGKSLCGNYLSNQDPASGFFKSGNTWRLKPSQLAPCKALFEWREKKAREKNIPRSRILKDAQIFDVIMRNATTAAQLKAMGLPDSSIRKFGKEILAINTAEYLHDASLDTSEKPLSKSQRDLIRILKDQIAQVAKDNHIASEILVRKSEYHALARLGADAAHNLQQNPQALFCQLADWLTGWRHDFFKQQISQ